MARNSVVSIALVVLILVFSGLPRLVDARPLDTGQEDWRYSRVGYDWDDDFVGDDDDDDAFYFVPGRVIILVMPLQAGSPPFSMIANIGEDDDDGANSHPETDGR